MVSLPVAFSKACKNRAKLFSGLKGLTCVGSVEEVKDKEDSKIFLKAWSAVFYELLTPFQRSEMSKLLISQYLDGNYFTHYICICIIHTKAFAGKVDGTVV